MLLIFIGTNYLILEGYHKSSRSGRFRQSLPIKYYYCYYCCVIVICISRLSSGKGQLAGTYECDNEFSGYIKCGEFPD
jgi:hypothetical protein